MRIARLALLLSVALGVSSPAFAAGDGETLDAVHHTSDGYYLDFSPIGKVELPRLFVTRRDGSIGFDFYGSSTAAVASGQYMIEAHEEGHADEAHAEGGADGDGGLLMSSVKKKRRMKMNKHKRRKRRKLNRLKKRKVQ